MICKALFRFDADAGSNDSSTRFLHGNHGPCGEDYSHDGHREASASVRVATRSRLRRSHSELAQVLARGRIRQAHNPPGTSQQRWAPTRPQ